MNNKYKIILSSRNLYKEVELPIEALHYSIGTHINCDFRLHKEFFFEDIQFDLTNNQGQWSIICSDNLYITEGNAKKLLTKILKHGDDLYVKYEKSNHDVFEMKFMVDFDSAKVDYERKISLENRNKVLIGVQNSCDIILKSEYVQNDAIELIRKDTGFLLNIKKTTYGVYHNGKLAENGEKIENGDFFAISDFKFYYKDNYLWTQLTEKCQVNLSFEDCPIKNQYPNFKRNTRIKNTLDEEEIEILDPPAKPQKQKSNLFLTLLPSMGMLLTSGIMAFMGGTMVVFSLVSGGMAILTAVLGVVQGNKDYKIAVKERIEKYNAYISNKKIEIEEYRKKEKEVLEQIYISREEKLHRFYEFSSDLFDRRKGDDDFLKVTLGIGNIEAVKKIKYKKQERLEIEDDLQEIPQQICEEYKFLKDAPIVCDFKDVSGIAVIGEESYRYELLKSMVFDITARQFHADVKLFFIVSDEHKKEIHKFRYLPYVNHTIGNIRNIGCNEESRKTIFEYLYNVLTEREQKKEYDTNFVVFFYDLCGFASHPLSRFVDKAKELGVTFVFFAEKKQEIPLGCNTMISVKDNRNAKLLDTSDITSCMPFVYDVISEKDFANIVQIMAAVETEEISLEGSLTKNINLFALLNILGVDDLDLNARWNSTKVYHSMAVPLGVSKTGIVYLDLHDKAHGPHGLVAGTTGSGKSEILQTYILSIATYFHPYEVAFVIIDFKGGGMVNQFKNLPHLLGAITNIDGKEIDRSLKSIKAELEKRQRLFAEAEVNHIDKYIKKFKAKEISVPLPHLIIIVDEFAELKAEQPDFMKELISAARIGRSLGVHLILATQKPAGQVDDQIWSNSRFKLCLKVQGPEDSNEVLKSPLAAEIKEPGRAYLQVGNNEIFELFQSAYSGAGEKAVDNLQKSFKISKLDTTGKRSVLYEQKVQKSDNNEKIKTQLEAIVNYVSDYCAQKDIQQLQSICLESLKSSVVFDEDTFIKKDTFDIGIYDDPDNQYQGSTYLDIETKHTFIIGASQYGKTNLIQLLIREIATKYSPKEANIYILDFASMALINFSKLHHVGGVVCSSDDEKLKNLFKLLQEEIVYRKEKLISVGVSSFTAYHEAGYTDIPHIFVFVDNMTSLIELYLENNDTFLTIIREGLSVGITTIVTSKQTSGISNRYLSNFANKIALYCNDTNEYNNLFDYVTLRPDEIAGRCIVEVENRILEAQTYLAFEGEKEYERADAIKTFIERQNVKYANEHAKVIPFIPSLLTEVSLVQEFVVMDSAYRLAMGLSYNEVVPFYMDFSNLGAIGLCGKEKKGHYNFVSGVLHRLNANHKQFPVQVCIFDDVSRKYKDLSGLEIVQNYTLDTNEAVTILNDWHYILEERYQAMMEEREPKNNDLLMMIIQNNEAAKKIYEDMDAMNQYMDMITRFCSLNMCIIFANYQNATVSYDAPEPIRMIKQERHLLCFDDLDNLKVFDVAYEDLKANRKKLQLGDAYYINDNNVTKLKLVKH